MPLLRFRTVAAKQMAAPTAQRTVLFRGRPSELHVWIKTASCNVLRWKNPDMVNENHLEEGEGRAWGQNENATDGGAHGRQAGRQLVRKYSTEGFFKDSPLVRSLAH